MSYSYLDGKRCLFRVVRIVTLYVSTCLKDVSGLVLVDALSEALQEEETPEQWLIQRRLIESDMRESGASHPALGKIHMDRSLDQLRAALPRRPIPLVVLSADRPWDPQIPSMIATGKLRHRCRAEESAGGAHQARAQLETHHQYEQRPRIK